MHQITQDHIDQLEALPDIQTQALETLAEPNTDEGKIIEMRSLMERLGIIYTGPTDDLSQRLEVAGNAISKFNGDPASIILTVAEFGDPVTAKIQFLEFASTYNPEADYDLARSIWVTPGKGRVLVPGDPEASKLYTDFFLKGKAWYDLWKLTQ